MRALIATTLPLLAVLGSVSGATAHSMGPDTGPVTIDETSLRLEAEVAAMVNAAGPPGDTDPAKLGQKSLFGALLRWPPGKVLTVCMQHKSKPLRVLIAKLASEWLQDKPNISFDFGALDDPRRCDLPNTAADIRVADQPASALSPYWSWVGIQALSHARDWTMDLGFDDGRDPPAAEALRWDAEGKSDRNYFHFVVLHEFGHALGALHEHQWGTCSAYLIEDRAVAEVFPSATTAANKAAALANLRQLQQTQVNAWGVVRLTDKEDPDSVMRYDFPRDIYRAGAPAYCAEAKKRLVSAGDRLGLGKAYPQPGQAVTQLAVASAAKAVLAGPATGLSSQARQRLVSLAAPPASLPSTLDAPPAAPARPIRALPAQPGVGALLSRLAAPALPRRLP